MAQINVDFDSTADFFEFLRKSHDFLSTIEKREEIVDVINDAVNSLKETIQKMTDAEVQLIAAFNDATNKIAAKLQALIDKPPVTTDNPEFVAALTAIKDNLAALGADTSNPVPSV